MKLNLFQLKNKYPKFIYKNYFWKIEKNNLHISFDFKISPDIVFHPKVLIKNINIKEIKKIAKEKIDNLFFHLGLIESISYWKATCSPIIEVECGFLDKEQINFWQKLIIKGMGQFFYENKIPFQRPEFITVMRKQRVQPFCSKLKNKMLIAIGGGKDSILTMEILKNSGKEIRCFSYNPKFNIKKILKIGNCKNAIFIYRRIDKNLLELNQKGFLNGHTPFSAYLAFLSVLMGVIFNYKYLVFSNEKSSNEGNVKYVKPSLAIARRGKEKIKSFLPKEVNHQYSKSFEFEKDFKKYSKKYLAKDIEYFSFLRPLYEIQITQLFAQYPQYFKDFISCNEAFKTASGTKKPTKKWCGKCPKCFFIFASLFPFVEKEKILKIFNKNLFEDKSLIPLMLELIGEKKFKPFECVGTKKESLIALYLSVKKYINKNEELPVVLNYFKQKIISRYSEAYLDKESKKMLDYSREKEKILKSKI